MLGANDRGQLGDGTTTDDPTPQPVPGLASVEALGLGLSHSCAATGGTLRCWGANSDSQVADVPGDVLAPVVVAGITDVTDVDGGADHTCARTDPDGKVLCWGSHAAGQLGRGTAPGGPTPSLVSAVTQAPSIVGALPARLVNGTTIDPVVLQGTGSGTVTVAHTGGSLPPGLAFDASVPGRLTVTGTPTVDGSYSFTLTATNGTAPDAVRTFDVEVGTAPVIESSLPPTMPVRSPVDLQLTASGSGPMTWSVVAGSDPLPAGLTLDAGGRLSGAPTAVGTATGTIEVSSDFGTDTLPFAIEVTYPIVTTIVGPGPDAGPRHGGGRSTAGGIALTAATCT